MTDGRWDGGRVSKRVTCVREDNPGPMTLDGTNTWVVRAAAGAESVVVDPGELEETHLRTVLEEAAPVGLVLLTHRHLDHSQGAPRFAELAGATVRAADASLCIGSEPLVDSELVEVDGLSLRVVGTPGHTTDSVCFLLDAERSLLSGDTILGRGTSVVAHPDGVLRSYLESLSRLAELVASSGGPVRLLPGHGPVLEDAGAAIDFYIAHRRERLELVRGAVADGAVTPREVVERVYADVDPALWPAADMSVAAQLEYLARG